MTLVHFGTHTFSKTVYSIIYMWSGDWKMEGWKGEQSIKQGDMFRVSNGKGLWGPERKDKGNSKCE